MPWCAFDASQENAEPEVVFTTPEMELLEAEMDDWSQAVHPSAEHAPAFHRSQAASTVVMPLRGASHSSLHAISNPPGLASIPESPKRAKERDDDDIVEVMKVRRGEGMLDVAYAHGSVPALKRSKTLRSRAAQALRSIKNVGKVPRKPTSERVLPAKENEHAARSKAPAPTRAPAATDKQHVKALSSPTHSSMPRLKKRVSQPLSNLFGLGFGGSQAVPNNASDADTGVVGVSPSRPGGGFRTLPYSRTASASTSALQLFTTDEAVAARPASPSFSLRGTRQKFSFVSLQSIFSGNIASASECEPVPEPLPAVANPEVDDPALPPRAVQTPVDDGWDSGEDYDSPRRHAPDPGTVRRPSDDESSLAEQEISFEMRLNSLHFDSFSFDADAFASLN